MDPGSMNKLNPPFTCERWLVADVSFCEENYEGSSVSHTTEKVVQIAMQICWQGSEKFWNQFTLKTRMLKHREWKGLAHSGISLEMAKVRTLSAESSLQILSTISYDEQFGEIGQPRGNKERTTSHQPYGKSLKMKIHETCGKWRKMHQQLQQEKRQGKIY